MIWAQLCLETPNPGCSLQRLLREAGSNPRGIQAERRPPHSQRPAAQGKRYGTASSNLAASGTVGRRQQSGPALDRRQPEGIGRTTPEPPAGKAGTGRKVQTARKRGRKRPRFSTWRDFYSMLVRLVTLVALLTGFWTVTAPTRTLPTTPNSTWPRVAAVGEAVPTGET